MLYQGPPVFTYQIAELDVTPFYIGRFEIVWDLTIYYNCRLAATLYYLNKMMSAYCLAPYRHACCADKRHYWHDRNIHEL